MSWTAIATIAILAGCIGAPYLIKVAPRTRRQWFYIGLTLTFVLWILPMVARLR